MQKCIELTSTNARRLDHINLWLIGSSRHQVLIDLNASAYGSAQDLLFG